MGRDNGVNDFTERALQVIQQIPEGKVMTYGQIAREAGNPRSARQVVRILHSMSRIHKLPWHRVINSKGELSLQSDEQRLLLELEGIEIKSGDTVSLSEYQFHPSSPD